MGNNRIVGHAVRAALAAAAASAVVPLALAQTSAPSATAQNVPSSADQSGTLNEVVVTGTRIQSKNLVSISPVTSVTAVDIDKTGFTRVEDILNNLPQVFAGQGSNLSNGADGTATVDLHDLGPQRTLVLVNGRRLGPGSADGRNFADINQIPAALIDHVDIETGGASAIYGADAVSGVVNFVLNTHFEGVKLDVNGGMYQHNNHDSADQAANTAVGFPAPSGSTNSGFKKDLAFIAGSNFADGAGNATVYATYSNQAAVLQNKFDYSACTLGHSSSAPAGRACGGSYTSGTGSFLAYNASGQNILYDTIDAKTGQMRPLNLPNDLYNYGPLNYYTRPSERWTSGAFLNLDVNEHAHVYSEFMYTRSTSTAQIAPSGDFGLVTNINCANPLLTAQEVATICTPSNLAGQAAGTPANSVSMYILRRNVEGGGRQETFTNQSYRTVIGVKGDFATAWTYDVSAQFNNVQIIDANLNYFSNTNLQNALNVVTGPNGQPTCESVINGTDPACVPWNIWVPGGVTKAATNYLQIPLYITGSVTEYLADASINADLGKYGWKLPWAENGVQLSLGTEWREDNGHFDPDLASILGSGAGGSGPVNPVAGQIHVSELFTEVAVPVLADLPGAKQVSLQGGYRYSSYSLGFNTNTFELGLEWAPIQDVRGRVSYNRAIRAPNIGDLYTPSAIGPGGSTDPCWGAHPSLTPAECARTGVTASEYGSIGANPANQFNTQAGGNPNLQPEVADTFTYGVVVQPSELPGFSATVDYYDIKIKDAILADPATAIILSCALENSASACGDIHRSTNGSLWLNNSGYVNTASQNAGVQEAKGIDIKVNYKFDLGGLGKLATSLQGTDVLSDVTQLFAGGPTYDCAGYWGVTCGNPLPKWRHTLDADWLTPWSGIDVDLRWRYIGGTTVDAANPSILLSTPKSVYPGFSDIGAYNYLDLSAAMAVSKNLTVRVGINNLLDKDPPLVLSGNCAAGPCNGNTFAQVYDVLGRYLYARVTAQF